MWLVITFAAAVTATALHYGVKNLRKYRLDFLALMLWGTFIMVFVDHAMAYAREGGAFITFSTDGLITDSALLGVLMVVPLVAVWAHAISRGERSQTQNHY